MKKQLLMAAMIAAATFGVQAQTGNVGIGTTNPQAKLQVAGTMIVDSLKNPTTNNYVVMAEPSGKLVAAPVNSLSTGSVTYNGGGFDYMNGNLRTVSRTTTLTANDYLIQPIQPSGSVIKLILPDPASVPQKLLIILNPQPNTLVFETTTGGTTYTKEAYGTGANAYIVNYKFKSDGIRWLCYTTYFPAGGNFTYIDSYLKNSSIGPVL